jgi:hypothetical protein
MNKYQGFVNKSAALGLVIAAGCLLGSTASADASAGKIVLSGYADGVGGESLMAGDYAAIIGKLGAHGVGFSLDPVAASTNLCIAYIMTHAWDKADGACDAAVRVAKLDQPTGTLYERAAHDRQVAIAYSNRAVLHSLEANPQQAASDLARAFALAPDSELITRNRAALPGIAGS